MIECATLSHLLYPFALLWRAVLQRLLTRVVAVTVQFKIGFVRNETGIGCCEVSIALRLITGNYKVPRLDISYLISFMTCERTACPLSEE